MIPPVALTALGALMPGPGATRLMGAVVLGEGGPELEVAGRRLPLPEGAPTQLGAQVPLLLSKGPQGARLQLAPASGAPAQAPGAAAAGATAGSATAQLAQLILQELAPGSELSPAQLGALIPQALPAGADPVRRMLTRMLKDSKISAAREGLLSLLGEAEDALPADRLARYQAQLGRGRGLDAAGVAEAAEDAVDTVEGRLWRGEDPFEAPLSALRQLADDPELAAWADAAGARPQLDAQLEALRGAYAGAQLVNSRALEAHYRFFELSPAELGGAKRLQVHLLSEQGKPLRLDGASIVLDLETEALGPVWMRVHTRPGSAQLNLQVARDSVRQSFEQEAQALRDVLQGLGFSSARVQIQPWDGDRVQATSELMTRYAGFEAEL